MSQSKLVSTGALVAIAFIAACSDSTTQPGGDLTTDQIQSMTGALSVLFGVTLGHEEARRNLPAPFETRRVLADPQPISGSTSCPEGGRIAVIGTFTIDTTGDGIFWTFTSKPTAAVTIEDFTNIHGDSIDLVHSSTMQTAVGTVQYSTGSLSGTCPLDVSIRNDVTRGAPTADSSTLTVSTVGTVCGHSVTGDTSFTKFSPPLP